jgi:hypothetical protein
MYQVWSKSIERCCFSSVHKDAMEERTDVSVTISLRNFVGEGIIKQQWTIEEIFIFSTLVETITIATKLAWPISSS